MIDIQAIRSECSPYVGQGQVIHGLCDELEATRAKYHGLCLACDVKDTRIAELEAERDRLMDVVDKLPKTADGVPVVPGMHVWHCTNLSYGPKGSDKKFPNTEGLRVAMPGPYCLGEHCYSEGCQGDGCSGKHLNFAQCYSTREAAQAAGGTT